MLTTVDMLWFHNGMLPVHMTFVDAMDFSLDNVTPPPSITGNRLQTADHHSLSPDPEHLEPYTGHGAGVMVSMHMGVT
jgi:hypothetical protein